MFNYDRYNCINYSTYGNNENFLYFFCICNYWDEYEPIF